MSGGGAERPPDLADAVLGFRVWSLRTDGRLGAIVAGSIWQPGVNEAVCSPAAKPELPRRHRSPHPGCVCGFNAYFAPGSRLRANATSVLGAIAAWGEMDVYATGFRAQFAQVIALAIPAGGSGASALTLERLKRAAARYEVPLVPAAKLRQEALRHASPLSPGMLPKPPAQKGAPAPPPAGVLPGQPAPQGTPAPQQPAAAAMPRPVVAVATWRRARGNAIWIRRHVTTNARRTGVELGLAPGAAAIVDPQPEVVALPRGTRVEAGDCVASVSSAYPGRRVHLCSPFGGTVSGYNGSFAAQILDGDRSVSSAPWLVEVDPDATPLEDTPLLWGRPGVELYRQSVARQSDAAVLAELTPPPGFAPSALAVVPQLSPPGRGEPALAFHQRTRTSLSPEKGRRAAIMVEHLRPLLQACGSEGTLLAA